VICRPFLIFIPRDGFTDDQKDEGIRLVKFLIITSPSIFIFGFSYAVSVFLILFIIYLLILIKI